MTHTAPQPTPAPADLAIDLAHVAKTYRGRIRALQGIELHVRRGEIFGLLGPNGAGKSTLVKILMTVIRPSDCRGTMLGEPVGRKKTLRRVGYLPEHNRFPEYLTGAQILDFYGRLADVPGRARRQRAAELLEIVGMTRWARHKVKTYSKGMRQRIGIAQALINDPDLVVLDEPTDGVDPVGRREIRGIVGRMRDQGKTVFINSHLLSELEMVIDRAAILVSGRVVRQGNLDELAADQGRYEIVVQADAESAKAHFEAVTPPGEASEGIEIDKATLRLPTMEASRVQPIIDELRARGVVLSAVRPIRPSLEDIFMTAVTAQPTPPVPASPAPDDEEAS